MSTPQTTSTSPYTAPAQDSDDHGLAPDTEFLLSGECVLCGDSVNLPKICIETGETEKLVRFSETLKYRPPLLKHIEDILFTCLVMGAMVFDPIGLRWSGGGAVVPFGMIPVLMFVLVSGYVVIWGFLLRSTRHVAATWYISRDTHQKRIRYWWTFGMTLVAAIVMLSDIIGWVQVSALAVMTARSFPGTQKPRPLPANIYRGLVVMTGFGPEFLRKVQELIDHHASKSEQDPLRPIAKS